jgi:molybdopterin synthase sulfur carrier subunit
MVTVEFLGPIEKSPLRLEITNLSQLSDILTVDDTVSYWVDSCAVAINDTIIQDKNITLESGDKISLLPPVCGG